MLHYTDEGTGSPVLFIHGLGGRANNWLRQRRSLSARHRVIAVDLPGHGRSRDIRLDYAEYAPAIDAVLEHLDLRDVTVVGLAMGARLAIAVAARAPERVSRIALVNAYLSLPPDEHERRVELYQLLLEPDGVPEWGRRLLERMGVMGYPGIVRGFMGSLDEIDPLYVHEIFEQTMRVDEEAELRRLTVPVQILVGAKDDLVPEVCTERLQELAQHPVTHVFPDAGHLPYLEQPAEFDRVLERFISGVDGSGD